MILGLSGHAGCGKDSMADRLVSRHGFVKVALADPLKRFCREAFGFTVQQLWGPSQYRNAPDRRLASPDHPDGVSPREALQRLGTEFGRALWPDVWIRCGLTTAAEVLRGRNYEAVRGLTCFAAVARDVVIPDVRFRNEVLAVQRFGGKVLRLRRAGCAGAVGVAGHASESEQDGIPDSAFDLVLDVAEGLEAFGEQINSALARLQEGPG